MRLERKSGRYLSSIVETTFGRERPVRDGLGTGGFGLVAARMGATIVIAGFEEDARRAGNSTKTARKGY